MVRTGLLAALYPSTTHMHFRVGAGTALATHGHRWDTTEGIEGGCVYYMSTVESGVTMHLCMKSESRMASVR